MPNEKDMWTVSYWNTNAYNVENYFIVENKFTSQEKAEAFAKTLSSYDLPMVIPPKG